MDQSEKKPQKDVDVQIVVGIIGLVLSVLLHELFHIVVHWDGIQHVSFFPSLFAIAQVDVTPRPGADIEGEEGIAYAITFIVILITFMIINKIRDTNDDRTPSQIIFPKDKDMQSLSPSEILERSGLDEYGPIPEPAADNSLPKKKK